MIRPPTAYRLASAALAGPMAAYTLRRAWRDGGWRYLGQRYGHIESQPRATVWLHCASVGEVNAALPLVAALARAGIGPLLMTTNTPTGQHQAHAQAPKGTAVGYLPIDRPRAVERFLTRADPQAALILETELWPHLFAGLAERGVPIALINARLSERSTRAPGWWQRSAAWCLGRTRLVLARSEADRQRLEALGTPAERVTLAGNLKWAAAAPAAPIDPGRPFCLAASTHDDEELRLARAWRQSGPPDELLVMAPRHPERGAAIARALASEGLPVARRSQGEPPAPGPGSIYIADTLGELPGLMAGAELVIMGGSLIPHGGQNVVEAARAGRAILTGPQMANFADETAGLERAGALLRLDDAAAIVARARGLLADAVRRSAKERAAARWAGAVGDDIVEAYMRHLATHLGSPFTA
jgi:3-deoxy-D-manno-octulosonic-acid transferase